MAILSIQSHVVYGHVGNRSAVFPLERLGFEVWSINTVQFSNHSGYDTWRGEVFSSHQIGLVWAGVKERGVLPECEAILSGYLGDADIGNVILSAVRDVKAVKPEALYCCDPVMGDHGRGFFVRPGIPEFLRTKALPLADILTPNHFEAENLVDRSIRSVEDAKKACRSLHAAGPRVVLIKSWKPEGEAEDTISLFLSDGDSFFEITTPELSLDPEPNGAGDMASALFLGYYLKTGSTQRALEDMTNAVFSVLEQTGAAASRELRIVQSQGEIAEPRLRFKAREL